MNPGIRSLGGAASSGVGRPLRVVAITSGTGTFTPRAPWLKVTALGGGAGGNSGASSGYFVGGAAAIPVEAWVKAPGSGIPYSIGAGGVGVASTAGTGGSNTTFGDITAFGAKAQSGGVPATVALTGGALNGQSNAWGVGGSFGAATGGDASGYGAGGGGSAFSGIGGNATGGLLIIEEYP